MESDRVDCAASTRPFDGWRASDLGIVHSLAALQVFNLALLGVPYFVCCKVLYVDGQQKRSIFRVASTVGKNATLLVASIFKSPLNDMSRGAVPIKR